MSMFTAFNISASGMTAQQLRTDVISENIANAGAQAIQAMGSIANAIDSTDGKSKSADTAKPATATSTPTTATSAPAVETPATPAAEPPQNLPNSKGLKIARIKRGYGNNGYF